MAIKTDLSELPRKAEPSADRRPTNGDSMFAHLVADRFRTEAAKKDKADGRVAGPVDHAYASSAGGCERKIGMTMAGYPREAMDLSGWNNVGIGNVLHDIWQTALVEQYGDAATIEQRIATDDGSLTGYVDAVLDLDEKRIAIEVKSIGGYGYKLAAVGRNAEGPKHDHYLQAAIYGVLTEADEIRIVYLAKEAVSVNIAKKNGVDEVGRFAAEWTYTREEFEADGIAEIDRLTGIAALVVDEQKLPPRVVPGLPDGAEIIDVPKSQWAVYEFDKIADVGALWNGAYCGYCPHRVECANLGPGYVKLPETVSA